MIYIPAPTPTTPMSIYPPQTSDRLYIPTVHRCTMCAVKRGGFLHPPSNLICLDNHRRPCQASTDLLTPTKINITLNYSFLPYFLFFNFPVAVRVSTPFLFNDETTRVCPGGSERSAPDLQPIQIIIKLA